MIKFLKHLISFLLIFGLTVNDCSAYSGITSSNYIQVSNINSREEFRQKHSKLFVHTGKVLSEQDFSILLHINQNLRKSYSSKSLIILKLRSKLYKAITSIIAQRAFLQKTNTSNNQYSSLYIA